MALSEAEREYREATKSLRQQRAHVRELRVKLEEAKQGVELLKELVIRTNARRDQAEVAALYPRRVGARKGAA